MASCEDLDPTDSAPPPCEALTSTVGSVTSVKVAVRVRPLIGIETTAGCQECIFGDSDRSQARVLLCVVCCGAVVLCAVCCATGGKGRWWGCAVCCGMYVMCAVFLCSAYDTDAVLLHTRMLCF